MTATRQLTDRRLSDLTSGSNNGDYFMRGQNDTGTAFEFLLFAFGLVAAIMLYALWKVGF